MTTLSWISRGGPPAMVVAALLAVGPAGATNASQHRYSITGSLTPAAGSSANGGGVQMKSTLGRPQPSNAVQSGGSFVVMAKMIASPTVCAGDTIFADGFE